jgi:hypothetical protein
VVRRGTRDSAVLVLCELSPGRSGMEDLADLDAKTRELGACDLDGRNDEIETVSIPGAAIVIRVPNWIDAPEPGGVN